MINVFCIVYSWSGTVGYTTPMRACGLLFITTRLLDVELVEFNHNGTNHASRDIDMGCMMVVCAVYRDNNRIIPGICDTSIDDVICSFYKQDAEDCVAHHSRGIFRAYLFVDDLHGYVDDYYPNDEHFQDGPNFSVVWVIWYAEFRCTIWDMEWSEFRRRRPMRGKP